MPYIMILTQAVIQILQSLGPLWVKCLSLKREIILSNIHRILRKVTQVIYIMYPNWMHGVMILAPTGHVHLGYTVYAKYRDPSLSGYPDIAATRSFKG